MHTSALPAFSLADRVAVVTGALGLLGQEHCAALAGAGASVVVADLDAERAVAFAAKLRESYGGRTLGTGVDITQPESLDALATRVLELYGRLDVLVNNAAIDDKFDPSAALAASSFEAYDPERFRRQLDVNVTGTFLCCQRLGRCMAERGSGSIINVASTYALVAPEQSLYRRPDGTQAFFKGPAYPTSKGAVLQLTRYLAAYWGRSGVRVNALCPGGVEAGQESWFQAAYAERTLLGRMARRSDYRGAVIFLASDASAYMTGASLVVDGGYTTC